MVCIPDADSRHDDIDFDDNILQGSDDPITHSQFRDKIYHENPGVENIIASREDFLDTIVGIYVKDTNMNFAKKPSVFFMGEPGKYMFSDYYY
jgi:hypothetical protein